MVPAVAEHVEAHEWAFLQLCPVTFDSLSTGCDGMRQCILATGGEGEHPILRRLHGRASSVLSIVRRIICLTTL